MELIFFVCFGVGVGYVFISFLLGEAMHMIHFDTHVDVSGTVSPFKPTVIAAFLTVFGGSGLLLIRHMIWFYALMLAAGLGLLIAFLMYRFVVVPLYRAQNTSTVEKQSLIGHTAMVSEKIPQGGFGKITYYVNGSTYTAPAKTETGEEIARRETVEILSIRHNAFYVKKKYETTPAESGQTPNA